MKYSYSYKKGIPPRKGYAESVALLFYAKTREDVRE